MKPIGDWIGHDQAVEPCTVNTSKNSTKVARFFNRFDHGNDWHVRFGIGDNSIDRKLRANGCHDDAIGSITETDLFKQLGSDRVRHGIEFGYVTSNFVYRLFGSKLLTHEKLVRD